MGKKRFFNEKREEDRQEVLFIYELAIVIEMVRLQKII